MLKEEQGHQRMGKRICVYRGLPSSPSLLPLNIDLPFQPMFDISSPRRREQNRRVQRRGGLVKEGMGTR